MFLLDLLPVLIFKAKKHPISAKKKGDIQNSKKVMPAARSLFILKIAIGKKPTVGAAVLILKVDSPNCKNYNVDERL